MILLEYEAKALLKQSGITVPSGVMVREGDDIAQIATPCVVKSQVPVGGRGKAGGVKLVDAPEELPGVVDSILRLEIKGHTPRTLLVEEKLAIDRELYLSAMISREHSVIELLASREGGVEVESNTNESFLRINLNDHRSSRGINTETIAEMVAEQFDLSDKSFVLEDLVRQLIACLHDNDATLVEINPLVLTADGALVAGDAKITVDDSAAYRHSDWDFETPHADANFVTLDNRGKIATIANGAGLAMATVDAVAEAGMQPANFLDIGGGANEASVTKAFERILEYEDVQAILINIFAGITRCDEVARAIIHATSSFDQLPELFIRLEGTNSAQAQELLKEAHIHTYQTLEAALAAMKESTT